VHCLSEKLDEKKFLKPRPENWNWKKKKRIVQKSRKKVSIKQAYVRRTYQNILEAAPEEEADDPLAEVQEEFENTLQAEQKKWITLDKALFD